jgi:hypothetical protein
MTTLRRLWHASPPLIAAALLMLAALAGSLAGLVLDPRLITGAPAWLKPVKFAASTTIYMATLAGIFSYLPDWPRLRRIVGWMTAGILVAEVAIIDLQAARGTTSHFNLATPFDAVLFAAMGLGILVQTISAVVVAVALWRQEFADRALGWAMRLGMIVTILGASVGGMMTRPTGAQLADARAGHRMTIAGAHTVGAPDGGAGLPGTGWSVEHGDLRVPHFVGLHAMQMLPLLALIIGRFEPAAAKRTRLVVVATASYLTLFVLLLAQALQGEPVATPSAATMMAGIVWAGGTLAAAWLARGGSATASANAVILG